MSSEFSTDQKLLCMTDFLFEVKSRVTLDVSTHFNNGLLILGCFLRPQELMSRFIGHFFVTPWSFQRKKRKHLQTSEVPILSQLSEESTFVGSLE